jgi:precorrin-6B C5,15-methyltransferase / cobalt-precorrin-6B C5,C15-methyltransferase
MNVEKSPWLTIVGIGEDGLDGLGAEARRAIDQAEMLAGGKRHLSKVPDSLAEKVSWGRKFGDGVEALQAFEGKRVVILTSGDPMHYGAGSALAKRFGIAAMTIIPVPGAFSLAAARMGWSLPDVSCMTVHGRPLETVNLYLRPGARLLALSWDGATPAKLAALLVDKGYPDSRMTVLELMGGENENAIEATAKDWDKPETAALNTIAVECIAGSDAVSWSRAPGLPEDAFQHDNKITKREVRATTIAALAPLPGETLWDIGAGSGTVAIEWLRLEPAARAVATESNEQRLGFIRANALDLGVPRLEVIEGRAPEALDSIEGTPEAIFVGGGVFDHAVMDACWGRLAQGGRMVANAVTLEAQQSLLRFREQHGGEITQISVAREGKVGPLSAMRPMMEVWQLRVEKI